MLKKIKFKAKNWIENNRSRLLGERNLKRLTMCKKCYTFYYKNSWHFYKPKDIEMNNDEEIPVRFIECSACLEQEASFYEMENLVFGTGV